MLQYDAEAMVRQWATFIGGCYHPDNPALDYHNRDRDGLPFLTWEEQQQYDTDHEICHRLLGDRIYEIALEELA